ncbi:alpha-D-ribose 1-methylphosphonate 5-triphosphate diphosphatase [Pontivivens ytuae]|uniref:Alpha-D-ribose 1-methylphosphonate 5-triphosphate diphosphatase n=1 Tax=Pontivivens ytuae TaxID=2789856 RepID=A0A7S9LPY1_9RHOB|nr:alpha-D-ribose 1-methylphosphonate 5-triphosphate diphosphatase [Pontivivens ytuae]QPH52590.1 alpha-D-ribose 1-methylphosphonate 5-triphosphate diphosphatase [Pontivivens ytuae]
MTQDLVLANATLILDDETRTGRVTVEDGKIAGLDFDAAVPEGAVDCGGDWVAPGLIELHTDNLERHMTPRPGVNWPHEAALLAHDAELAGTGITTVFDAMRVGSIPKGKGRYLQYARDLSREMLALRAAGVFKISHFLHLRAEICSETLVEELAEFGPEDRVGLLSLMDHTPGQRQFRDIGQLKTYVMGKNNLDEAGFDEHVARLYAVKAEHGARNEAAALEAARVCGAVLASHDDTDVAHVEESARHGIQLAEFPTSRAAAQACRDHGIAVMMGAPNVIRGGSHSGNVAAGELAEAGLLDILSSDYVPAALLLAAARLGALWDDMARALATVTSAPAAAVGLDDRGRLAPGLRADLVRFREREGGTPVVRGVWSQGRQVA